MLAHVGVQRLEHNGFVSRGMRPPQIHRDELANLFKPIVTKTVADGSYVGLNAVSRPWSLILDPEAKVIDVTLPRFHSRVTGPLHITTDGTRGRCATAKQDL